MRAKFVRLVVTGLTCALAASAFAGCSSRRVTDFTIISTKNTLMLANAERDNRRITGEDCRWLLFGMPEMKEAIDDAVEKAGPEYDALVDGVVTIEDNFFETCYRVEGTPIKAIDPAKFWGAREYKNAKKPTAPKPAPPSTP